MSRWPVPGAPYGSGAPCVVAGIWLACAVFSPVFAEWRDGWSRRGTSPFPYPRAAGVRAAGRGERLSGSP